MRKEVWAIGGSIIIVVAVLGALVWQQQGAQPPPSTATATPLPSPTPAPVTETAVPTPATPTPTPLPASTLPAPTLPALTPVAAGLLDLGDGMTITLAPGWVGALHPAPAALGLADPNGAPLLAAWQGAEAYLDAPQRMTLIRAPRAGIPLPAYLTDLAAMVAATPGLAVAAQQITDTLRSDGFPAAELTFTQSTPPARGWQAALIDPSGDDLLLLTLVTDGDVDTDTEAQFRALVASITFQKP